MPTHVTSWNKNSNFSWDTSDCKSDCSWFAFKISVKENTKLTKTDLAKILDLNNICIRILFGGNLIRQPAFVKLKKYRLESFRIASDTSGSDQIMNDTLFLGTYPGLTKSILDFEIETINQFCKK